MPIIDIDAYLRRLGLSRPRPRAASAEALAEVHRAHVSRVPYENLLIQLARPAALDVAAAAARIVGGGGGYCFELNGALAALLAALGFQVSVHEGRVWHDRGRRHTGIVTSAGRRAWLSLPPRPRPPSSAWHDRSRFSWPVRATSPTPNAMLAPAAAPFRPNPAVPAPRTALRVDTLLCTRWRNRRWR